MNHLLPNNDEHEPHAPVIWAADDEPDITDEEMEELLSRIEREEGERHV